MAEECWMCKGVGIIEDGIGVRTCQRCRGEGQLTTREADAIAKEIRDQEKLDEARGK